MPRETADPSLLQVLLRALSADGIGEDPQLAAALQALCDRARTAWPRLELPAERFVAHLGARLTPAGDLRAALAAVRAEDLYLAAACAHAVPGAVEACEARYFGELGPAIGEVDPSPSFVDEVKQLLRRKLFVGDGGPPEIASYAGRGDLGRWLRVSAARTALSLRRQGRREVPVDDDLFWAMPSPEESPELGHIRQRYRVEFKQAVEQAARALTPRERNLLRQHVLDGLTIDDLAGIYRVHRTTAFRWIEKAREKLVEQARQALMARLRVDDGELESIMRLIQSHVELTFRRVL